MDNYTRIQVKEEIYYWRHSSNQLFIKLDSLINRLPLLASIFHQMIYTVIIDNELVDIVAFDEIKIRFPYLNASFSMIEEIVKMRMNYEKSKNK